MQRESQLEFLFEQWVSLNRLDPELVQLLRDQKIDSVAAILGIQDEDIRHLFQGYPIGFLTSFRYARTSLASLVASGPEILQSNGACASTPPDPVVQHTAVDKPVQKPKLPPRKSTATRSTCSEVPKEQGETVRQIASRLEHVLHAKQPVPVEQATPSPLPKVKFQHGAATVPEAMSTPPPIPQRPSNATIAKLLQHSTTNSLDSPKQQSSLADDCSSVDSSSFNEDFYPSVVNEVYYDVLPMTEESKRKIFDFKDELEDKLKQTVKQSSSRFSVDDVPLYQHYEQQEVTIKRNRTFEPADRRSDVTRKSLPPPQPRGRTFWSDLPEVIESNVLKSMTEEQIACKEALFEIITSQVCFVRSLTIATTFFVHCPMLNGQRSLGSCIDMQERKQLFSNLTDIKDINDELIELLEANLASNIIMPNVVDIIINHLTKYKKLYVTYCSNQTYQERMLSFLKTSNPQFQSVMAVLEGSPHCESLDLRSFLLSPMQRVTRYPLLLTAVIRRTPDGSLEYVQVQKALQLSNHLANECNETARKFERIEQLVELEQKFVYESSSPKRMALANSDRWLLKQNLVTEIYCVNGKSQTRKLFVFLFTDKLVITKPHRNGKQYVVVDYCLRPFVEMIPVERDNQSNWPPCYPLDVNDFIIQCIFLQNSDQKRKKYFLKFETSSDKIRWLDAYKPPTSDDTERIYDRNDCPRVEVISEYKPNQEDELELKIGDFVNVLQKMCDGWYQGERVRDSVVGWFPNFHVQLTNTDHEKAKTMRERQKMVEETRKRLTQMKLNS